MITVSIVFCKDHLAHCILIALANLVVVIPFFISLLLVIRKRYHNSMIARYTNKSDHLATPKYLPNASNNLELILKSTTIALPPKKIRKCKIFNLFLLNPSIAKKTNIIPTINKMTWRGDKYFMLCWSGK